MPKLQRNAGISGWQVAQTSSLDKYELLNMWPEFEGARAARAQEGQRSSEGRRNLQDGYRPVFCQVLKD